MRTIFFGTPELALPTLAATYAAHEVLAVVCQPDKPRGRKRRLMPPPIKVWAEAHGVPVHQPSRLNDGAFEAWLKDQQPDVCVLVAYGRLLKQPILDVPRHGFLNLHPSRLPKLRGPSPIQSAILQGITETAITIMRLDAGMDAGDIVLQEVSTIYPADTGVTLTERLAHEGAPLMLRALEAVEQGTATFTPQDHAAATYCNMIAKSDGVIDWSRPALELHNLVRGAQPWPMAQCFLDGAPCKIHVSSFSTDPRDAPPGTITGIEKDRVFVATGEGQLAILSFQAPGKKAMPMADYLRGHPLQPGDRFDEVPMP